MISIIAGIGKNNELGKENALLWHLPADLMYFKKITSGHTVIMGRKTFESIGRPLPNRQNIVITRDTSYAKEGILVANSLEQALSLSIPGMDIVNKGDLEVFIIGGAEIYKQAINIADKLYITHINAEDKDADSFFPVIDKNIWHEVSRAENKADDKNPFDYSFVIYEKY